MGPGQAEIQTLGDSALLVRFDTRLSEEANRRAIGLAAALQANRIDGVVEVVPSLVSVLVRYDARKADPTRIAGEISLRLGQGGSMPAAQMHRVSVRFDGPDLASVAAALGMTATAFITQHNAAPLRVLATGFAPGFVYCGFHPDALIVPRRTEVRPSVPAGSVLFAAGQTAIAATDIPTGWHVIGHTDLRNFDAHRTPPTQLNAGDMLQFEAGS